jgi:DNA-directed RNA polymerase specialized sigma24 family protein
MRKEPWQIEEVVTRMREAGDTVRRLPRPRGPAQFGNGWPDIVRDAREAYGYEEPRLRPPAPTPRAIDRMDEVFTWFAIFEDRVDEMRAVWFSVCLGISFAQTARILGVNRKTVRSRVWAGVQSIVAGLNKSLR